MLQKQHKIQQPKQRFYIEYIICAWLLFFVIALLPIAPVFAAAAEETLSGVPEVTESASEVHVETEPATEAEVVETSPAIEESEFDEEEAEALATVGSESEAEPDSGPTSSDTENTEVTPESEQTESEATAGSSTPDVTEEPVAPAGSSSTPTSTTVVSTAATTTPAEPQSTSTSETVPDTTPDTTSTTSETTVETDTETGSDDSSQEQNTATESQAATQENVTPHSNTQPSAEDEHSDESDADDDETQASSTDSGTVSAQDAAPRTIDAVVYNSESEYIFSATECVSVGDGSFYCSEANPAGVLYATDRVFAAQDDEGDKEIYVELNEELLPITNNQVDDDAPYYDEITNTILWHRLIDSRYQIIEYDVDTATERQLTSGRDNNMEPTRYGETIVWQSWIGGDWDIVMLRDGERLVLTDNDSHDITPNINGDHIIWQSFTGEKWQVKVYDRRTETIEVIEDGAGGSVENPRFVLVYDTKFKNGDIETKGYDLRSGEVVPLSSQGAPTPVNIPDPEQTGEERAMVSPTVQVKTKSATSTDTDSDSDSYDIDMTVSTSTEPVDLIVTPYVETPATTTAEVQAEAELQQASSTAEFEVVVEPVTAASTETIEIVDETANEEDNTDSQASVATST